MDLATGILLPHRLFLEHLQRQESYPKFGLLMWPPRQENGYILGLEMFSTEGLGKWNRGVDRDVRKTSPRKYFFFFFFKKVLLRNNQEEERDWVLQASGRKAFGAERTASAKATTSHQKRTSGQRGPSGQGTLPWPDTWPCTRPLTFATFDSP